MWQQSRLCCQRFVSKRTFHGSRRGFSSTSVAFSDSDSKTAVPPREAQVVICGGGAIGAAVAYHLALAGLGEETILVESSR